MFHEWKLPQENQEKTCPPAPRKNLPSAQNSRLRRFVFTLNNYSQEEYLYLTTQFLPKVKWIVIGKETGESGTPHLQGACILVRQTRFSTLKTLPGLNRCHIEPMMGSPASSLAYCTKQDSTAFVYGETPEPGKRNDLSQVVQRIHDGESLKDLAVDEMGGMAIVKFHRGLTVLRSMVRKGRNPNRPPCVIWVHGPTGVGKTKTVFSTALKYTKDNIDDIWMSCGSLQWFDGYDGQSIVIFDDIRSKDVSSFSFLLRITDRYPIRVPFKGGFVEWSPKLIFFTCPHSPSECFATRNVHKPEDIRQLLRRITLVTEYPEIGESEEELVRQRLLEVTIEGSQVFEEDQSTIVSEESDKE